MLEVVGPGFLSTIQDLGRPDAAALGVPSAGACDRRSLAIANLLLGNEPGATALEITLAGPELIARATCVVGLAGADLGAYLPDEARGLRPGGAHLIRAGSRLGFAARARTSSGVRAYLALPGGIDVPSVLGSAATYLAARFGGIEGRALIPGDRLRPRNPGDLSAAGRRWPHPSPPPQAGPSRRITLRIVAGPQGDPAILTEGSWRVDATSDRMGLRLEPLEGASRAAARPDEAERLSIPVPVGAIQLPPDGRPIVLLADHQTVGGYRVPAVVASVDLPLAGQAWDGDELRFELVTVEEAQTAWRIETAAMREARAALERHDPWDDLALDLGG